MLDRIYRKLITLVFKLKNKKHLECHGNIEVGKRVEVKAFNDSKKRFKIILHGNNKIGHDVILQGKGILNLGTNTYISSYSVIGCNDSITIGKNCMIANNVSIRDTDHKFESLNTPMIEQGIYTSSVFIDDNVWIGHGAVITKGVKIGNGSIIGANAVITKNVEPYSIMGGVPAKLIRKRSK